MMEGWKEYKLGDLVKLQQGFAVNRKSNHHISDEITKYPLLKISDLLRGTESLYVKDSIPKQFLVNEDEIIYSRTGQVGYAFMGRKGVVYNNCFRVTANEKIDTKYLYLFLNMQYVRDIAVSLATGAAQPDLNHGAFKSIKIELPPLPTQRKIASILSAYDDLIENNLQRIKLLEEMAQQTYTEWFVRMKFPGHENVEWDDESGLPEGWEKVKLGSVCKLTMGQSPKSEFYNTEGKGLPFHQGVKDYGDRFPTNSTWCTKATRIAEVGDILFSVRAPVGRLNIAFEKMILGRGLSSITYKHNWNGFLYYQLKQLFFEDNLMGGGAIFNSVTKNDMVNIELMEGSENIMQHFNDFVIPIDKTIKNLHIQNQNLKEARDILLPRLMMGVIKV